MYLLYVRSSVESRVRCKIAFLQRPLQLQERYGPR